MKILFVVFNQVYGNKIEFLNIELIHLPLERFLRVADLVLVLPGGLPLWLEIALADLFDNFSVEVLLILSLFDLDTFETWDVASLKLWDKL